MNPVNLTSERILFPASLLAGAGFVLILSRFPPRFGALLFVYALGYLVLGLVGYFFRYYLFLLPLLFVWAASFIFDEAIVNRMGRIRWLRTSWSMVVFSIVAAYIGLQSCRDVKLTIKSEPRYLFAIAEELRNHGEPGQKVISRKPHLAYLSGMTGVQFPLAKDAEDFVTKAREAGARYVVYSARDATQWDGLKSLANPENVPAELKIVHRHAPSETIIYEVIDDN
jgi:hypothetical protein